MTDDRPNELLQRRAPPRQGGRGLPLSAHTDRVSSLAVEGEESSPRLAQDRVEEPDQTLGRGIPREGPALRLQSGQQLRGG